MEDKQLQELRKHIINLSVFYDTFNQRPVVGQQDLELYYSEKLITKQQLEDYEKSIRELAYYYIREIKSKKGSNVKFGTLVSATRDIKKCP